MIVFFQDYNFFHSAKKVLISAIFVAAAEHLRNLELPILRTLNYKIITEADFLLFISQNVARQKTVKGHILITLAHGKKCGSFQKVSFYSVSHNFIYHSELE